MTRIDVLLIDDVKGNGLVLLTYGDDVHLRLDNRKSFDWIRVSIRGRVCYECFRYFINNIDNKVSIRYKTFKKEYAHVEVPKLMRQENDGEWQHFSLRINRVQ